MFQIAAHEEAFGLDRLLKLCRDLAPTLHAMKVGRVIARPFIGAPGGFQRTANRHDYAIAPPAPTLLDWVHGGGRRDPCDRQDRRHLLDAAASTRCTRARPTLTFSII